MHNVPVTVSITAKCVPKTLEAAARVAKSTRDKWHHRIGRQWSEAPENVFEVQHGQLEAQ